LRGLHLQNSIHSHHKFDQLSTALSRSSCVR
jgi:hypothetical protein